MTFIKLLVLLFLFQFCLKLSVQQVSFTQIAVDGSPPYTTIGEAAWQTDSDTLTFFGGLNYPNNFTCLVENTVFQYTISNSSWFAFPLSPGPSNRAFAAYFDFYLYIF